ncbi:MAG: tyrosine-type recombinase/integrase [Acidiferrobacteraceae bacterium]
MATITRRGQYQWRARVRRRGQVVSKTFATRKDAESWAHDAETAIAQGTLSGRTESENTTLGEALSRYAIEITPAKRSADRERGEIRRMQARPIASKVLVDIRGKDMAHYIRSRQADGVGANAIRIELALLSHVYTVARAAWGMESLVNPVPLAKIARPRLPPGRTRRLVDDEEARLLEAAKTYGGEIGRVIPWAIETAMRRGEIAAMRWEHLDRKARVLLIPETKTGTPRRVPLSTRALQVLEGLPRRQDGKVWGMRPDSISQAFERVCSAAGIEGLTFHDLRHEATSRLFEKGLNPMEVAAITGHKTLQMLKRYTHLRAEDLVGMLG